MAVVDNRLEPLLPTTALRANRVLTGHTIVDTTGGFRNRALPTVFFFEEARLDRGMQRFLEEIRGTRR